MEVGWNGPTTHDDGEDGDDGDDDGYGDGDGDGGCQVDPVEAGWSGPTKHVKPTAETTISLSQIQVRLPPMVF